jgi:hemoglobin/transferrin/lactoferrin receptor protein
MKSIFTVLILIFATLAFSQEKNKTDSTSYLDEVVVSANRWEQTLREVPNRVTKVTPSQIRFQNVQTSADLLGISNQVFIQKSQLGGGSPMLRGFATNRVMLVVDGVRMNNAIFRSGNLQNVISLDANAIQNAEVIFGPGSVMYGSDAIGGVMNFTTLTPQLSPDSKIKVSGNAFGRYSSANKEKTAHLDLNIGLNKWAFTTSITKGDYGNLTMGSHGPQEYTRPDYQVRDENGNDITVTNPDPDEQVNTGYDQINIMQKVRFKPDTNWDLSYAFHFSETSDVPRYDRLILKSGNTFTSAEWYYGPQKWSMHSFDVKYLKPSLLSDQVKLTLAYQNYQESRHNRNFTGSNRNRRTDRYEEVKAFSANLDLDKTLSEKVTLFYGAEFITNDVGSTAQRTNIVDGTTSGISTRYPDGSTWKTYAAYLSLRYALSEQWLIHASTRYTHVYTHATYDLTYFDFPFTEATLNNGALNGSFGLVFNPTTNWKLYTNFSSGFRAPNVDDIGKVFDSTPGTVVVPNPDLEPEKAYSAEIGITGKVAQTLTIDASAFYTLLDNAIARGPSTFNGQSQIDYDGTPSNVLALQNISELTVRGVQLGVQWDITRAFKLASYINLQKGKEKEVESGTNYSPTHIAPTFGTTQFSFKTTKFQAMLYANYNGEISYDDLALTERADSHLYAKDENGNPYSPSWFTLNLKTSYAISHIFSLDAGAENIFDKRYRPYSSGITAPGRNIFGTLRVRF